MRQGWWELFSGANIKPLFRRGTLFIHHAYSMKIEMFVILNRVKNLPDSSFVPQDSSTWQKVFPLPILITTFSWYLPPTLSPFYRSRFQKQRFSNSYHHHSIFSWWISLNNFEKHSLDRLRCHLSILCLLHKTILLFL